MAKGKKGAGVKPQVKISAIDLDLVRRYCDSVHHVAAEAAVSDDPRVVLLAVELLRTAARDLDRLIERLCR